MRVQNDDDEGDGDDEGNDEDNNVGVWGGGGFKLVEAKIRAEEQSKR